MVRGGHRGPRVGRSWSRGSGSGGRYPLTGGWGIHAGGDRGTSFGVKVANLLGVGLVFGRGRGVGRPCPGLKCSSLCDFCCGGGFTFRYGSVETVGDSHQCMAAMVVLIFRQLCRAAVGGLLGLPETSLHSVEGDPGQLDLDIGRYLSPEGGQVLHVEGGDRAVAMGEVGRCPRIPVLILPGWPA